MCSVCHGENGEGITTKDGNNYGPSLVGVGAAAVDFQVGTGRMPMAQPGSQAPRKEVVYTDDEIAEETDRLVQRDAADATQTMQAKDAVLIDTTYLTQADQVDRIVALANAVTHRGDATSTG
mgnify:CR=1 FL=1